MAIEQRVQMRGAYIQYNNYHKATTRAATQAATTQPWYKKLLTAGTRDDVRSTTSRTIDDEKESAHPIVRNISNDTYTRLAKASDRFPGLVLRQGAYRKYPFNNAGCHVIGMLGVVLAPDIDGPLNEQKDRAARVSAERSDRPVAGWSSLATTLPRNADMWSFPRASAIRWWRKPRRSRGGR